MTEKPLRTLSLFNYITKLRREQLQS